MGWDTGLAQDETQCPLPPRHIQQLVLVVEPRASTINGLDTSFCVAVLPACSVLVLLQTSGKWGALLQLIKSAFISSYLPTPHIPVFTVSLHIKRHFTASLRYPAEFIWKAEVDLTDVREKKLSIFPFCFNGIFLFPLLDGT